ncbi:uncharacterized protein [Parasteatoda tepidariorum]
MFFSIVEEKRRKEEIEEQRRKDEIEAQEKREQMEFELKKLEIESRTQLTQTSSPNGNVQHNVDLIKLIPKFKLRDDDIVIYLSLFERQAKRTGIDSKDWVSCLLTLLPSEIIQLIGRESEEKFEDYEYIKTILLKRFKLNPESFRKKFVMHQKSTEKSWRDFCYEITNYFEEWIDGLEIKDFASLKNLIITDQLKKKVPHEVRDHLLDEWANFVSPTKLADKLDEYDSVRNDSRKTTGIPSKDKTNEKWRPRSPPSERNSRNKSFYKQGSSSAYTPRKSDELQRSFSKLSCYTCGREGHTSRFCLKNRQPRNTPTTAQNNLIQSSPLPLEKEKPEVLTAKISIPVSKSVDISGNIDDLKLVRVKCGNVVLNGIVDTGAQISVVREKLVADIPCEGESKIEISSAFGESEVTPLKIFQMKINDELHGSVPITCAVSKKLVTDLLLSSSAYEILCENIELCHSNLQWNTSSEGEDSSDEPSPLKENTSNCAVITQISQKDIKNARMENDTKLDFKTLQEQDESLEKCFEWAKRNKNAYTVQNEILLHSENICGENIKQVVLPLEKRTEVLRMAHEIPLAGHLGEKKTTQRHKYSFFWPTIKQDVKKFCESCKECQLKRTITYKDRIPIQPIVRPETPFEV